jgi:hypothetical protein
LNIGHYHHAAVIRPDSDNKRFAFVFLSSSPAPALYDGTTEGTRRKNGARDWKPCIIPSPPTLFGLVYYSYLPSALPISGLPRALAAQSCLSRTIEALGGGKAVSDINQMVATKEQELCRQIDEIVNLKQMQITKLHKELEALQSVRQAMQALQPVAAGNESK